MVKSSRQLLACCPSCRLVHPSAGHRCHVCGDPHVTVPLSSLVLIDKFRRWQRRTPTRRGWRWFDLLFVAALVISPLELKRHDSSWVVPMLLGVAASWTLVRLVHLFITRYRFVLSTGPSRVRAIAFPPPSLLKSSTAPICGVARRLRDNVDAQLLTRRCLGSSLTLESEAEPGTVRLRRARTASFVVEQNDGGRVIVEGQVLLVGQVTATATVEQTRACFSAQGELDEVWLDGATAHEVLLQNRNKVEVSGGIRLANGDINGVAGSPIYVKIRPPDSRRAVD